jgi:ankyrin repeat protein
MVRLAVYPPSRATPDSEDYCGQSFGHVDPESKPGRDLQDALFCTKTWEGFQDTNAFFKESILLSKNSCSVLLAHYAQLGNTEIVRGLLDAGADIHGGETTNCNPLTIACQYCHEDAVDLLLEHGADPNYSILQQRGSPLITATAGGSFDIIRKLLDHGANVGDVAWHPLENAVRLEHTAMVELMLKLHNRSDSERRHVLKEVIENGLDSMVLLLQK